MSASNVIPLPRVEARPLGRSEPIAVLDLGTSKMCCLIARRRDGRLDLMGGGFQLSEGLRAGEIVDAEAAEASILAVVHEAEQQAGRTVQEIVVGISGARPESLMTTVEVELGAGWSASACASRCISCGWRARRCTIFSPRSSAATSTSPRSSPRPMPPGLPA
jgi:hypothetical protein